MSGSICSNPVMNALADSLVSVCVGNDQPRRIRAISLDAFGTSGDLPWHAGEKGLSGPLEYGEAGESLESRAAAGSRGGT